MMTANRTRVLVQKFFPVNYIFQPSKAQAGSFKVTRVIVNTLTNSHQGPCPKQFKFRAWITANNKGTVQARWVRSNGWRGPLIKIRFPGASTQQIDHSWIIRQTGSTHTHWASLVVLHPNRVTGNKAQFVCICEQ
jgi:hypothetical protein